MDTERTGLTDKDVQEARQLFTGFMQAIAERGKRLASEQTDVEREEYTRQLVRNDDYMEVRLKGNENITKLKTVFHSVEANIEDHYGGLIKVNYNIKNTVAGLHKCILENYPSTSVEDIERYAREESLSYEEAKKALALAIAEAEMWIRLNMARFLHEQLEPMLKLVISDLVDDAALSGLSYYGGRLAHASDIDRTSKAYINLRKKRNNAVKKRGERGEALISNEDARNFIEEVLCKIGELQSSGRNITANAVARKLVASNHTNPLKAFKDKLKKFDLTFEELKDLYMQDEN